MQETILILDFGSQYTQLIARRIRELNVYCEIHPYNHIPNIGDDIKGLILSGSPFSVNDTDRPDINLDEGKNNKKEKPKAVPIKRAKTRILEKCLLVCSFINTLVASKRPKILFFIVSN